MKFKYILSCFAFFVLSIQAQNSTQFFPDDLTIQPFSANPLEPRLGFVFQTGKNELRLDIGNSIDIVRISRSDNSVISLGADLFTYTLLRGEKNFHFPVDAVDYLFGINAGFKTISAFAEFGARLRLSHISAHFVDGHYDGTTKVWKDQLNPRVYSREFVELLPYIKKDSFRFYAGFTYLIHVTPTHLGKDIYQAGFDYYLENKISAMISPFVSYDLKIVHLNNYSANHSVIAGIKFGKPDGKGFSVSFQHYSGKSVHGEYFDVNKQYSAIGINLDL